MYNPVRLRKQIRNTCKNCRNRYRLRMNISRQRGGRGDWLGF